MKPSQSSVAKITRPRLPDIVRRRRLFRRLDRGAPVSWISGPAGSGKTTLVASWLDARKLPCLWYRIDGGDSDIASFFYYLGLAAGKAAPRNKRPLPLLTPEYGLGIPTFTQRFFESLGRRLKPPFFIVFDNFHEVPAESPFPEIMRLGLSSLPEGVRAVVISRAEPPPPFAGMLAGNKLSVTGWDDLMLTPDESKSLLRLQGISPSRNDLSGWMHEKTQGWAAGLVLLARAAKSASIDPGSLKDLPRENVFDYFASELFDRLDGTMREFLLQTALLPKLTPQAAAGLTGNRHAGRILAELSRRNYFTEKRIQPELSYQYHALFREFLLSRAERDIGAAELHRLRLEAAKLLERTGHAEDAAGLYIRTGSWDGLVRLVLTHARGLAEQGRSGTLGSWIGRLPDDVRAGNPWLLYWQAVCAIAFDPAESRRAFERAFGLFERSGDDTGTLMAWSGIADSHINVFDVFTGLDPWIDWLDKRMRRKKTFPSPEIEAAVACSMANALVWRHLRHPGIRMWIGKAVTAARKVENGDLGIKANYAALQYALWVGDAGLAAAAAAELERMARSRTASPLWVLYWKAVNSVMNSGLWFHPERSLRSAEEGLETGRKSGVHILDGFLHSSCVYALLNKNDLDAAGEHLAVMEAVIPGNRRNMASHHYFQRGWRHYLLGELSPARGHAEQAYALAAESGVPSAEMLTRILCARVLHDAGREGEAARHLKGARRIARDAKSPFFEYLHLLTQAHIDLDRAGAVRKNGPARKSALTSLKKAMMIGRKRDFASPMFLWPKSVLSRLCAAALAEGIEPGYANHLIRTLGLLPPDSPREQGDAATPPGNWPWPVKIHTLGRFELLRDDKPMRFPGKVQKKPLEMLKALTAFGGRNVSTERIIDALWPDAEGDLGYKSFETTLQRLRRLIGDDRALRLHDGRLGLDDRLCWVDARAFEDAARTAMSGARRAASKGGKILPAVETAVSLYRGHFLPSDTRAAWSAAARERLRSRFLRLIVEAGEALENAGLWKKAGELFERGIEKDAACEEFYQHLMICCKRLGQEARAVQVYKRCRLMLSQELGLQPSTRTEEIRMSLTSRR